MVCPIGNVKMAVMARLLAAGSLSQNIAEGGGHQKLSSQYISRALLEADEPNFLDEEDMHLFDSRPMTDPLHLVCCNACKKPVKASQYLAHAELCRSLGYTEELFSELDGGKGHRKPPKKERKKSTTAGNQATLAGPQERFGTIQASETARSGPQVDEHIRFASTLSVERKDISNSANLATVKDEAAGTTLVFADRMMSMKKRPKLIPPGALQPSDGILAARCVSHATRSQKAVTYIPSPLATKTYYSQRNNRLRVGLSYLYSEAPTKERCAELASSKISDGNMVTWQASSPRISSDEKSEDHAEKRYVHSSTPSQNASKIFAQISNGNGGAVGASQAAHVKTVKRCSLNFFSSCVPAFLA